MNNLCDKLLETHQTITDKKSVHNYIDFYDLVLHKFKDKAINFLEIGLFYGDSTKLWDSYFTNPKTKIFSFDKKLKRFNKAIQRYEYSNRVYLNLLNHRDLIIKREEFVPIVPDRDCERFFDTIVTTQFDIVIDDGSHLLRDQIISVKFALNNLKKGGVLIIEDVPPEHVEELLVLDDRLYVVDLRNNKKDVIDNILICMTI